MTTKARPPKSVTKTVLRGLAVILPVFVLGLLLYWLIVTVESSLARLFRLFLPDRFYFPGLGVGFALILSYAVGLAMSASRGQRLLNAWDRLLERLPLIKSIYGAVEDIVASFSTDRSKRFNRVVMVEFKDLNLRLLGYVTRDDLIGLPKGVGGGDDIIVYLPMSYQIGGYMVVVRRSTVTPLDLSVEDASRFVLTAGLSARNQNNSENQPPRP